MRCALATLVVALFVVVAVPARADEPPDVVRMRDGSFVRGRLVERQAGQYVILQDVRGALRQIALADVEYAGPERGEATALSRPAPSTPVPTGVSQQLDDPTTAPIRRIHVGADRAGLTLHLLTDRASVSISANRGIFGSQQIGTGDIESFRPICTAPCEAELPAGAYVFGVSERDGHTLHADEGIVDVGAGAQLSISLAKQDGLRALGWVLLIGSLGGAGTMAVEGILHHDDTMLVAGCVVAGAGLLLSLALVLLRDAAHVSRVA